MAAALKAGADAIVCGAGLPLNLPALAKQVPQSDALLAPIISSGQAAALICKAWSKRYNCLPDFVVLEGPQAGGHLGFTPEEAGAAQVGKGKPLSELLADVLEALKPFAEACIRCLQHCEPAKAPYCISRALISAAKGDWENGLFFCGANAGKKRKLTTVKDEMDQIVREWRNFR